LIPCWNTVRYVKVKMVSHFLVRTDLSIPSAYVAEFNEWIEQMDVSTCEELIPEYFDRFWEDPMAELPCFTRPNETFRHMEDLVVYNGWRANHSNFYSKIDYFHGAVSMMYYIIDAFCRPRGIILEGTIIGVNPAHRMVYVYTVNDNQIMIDSEHTHIYMLEYRNIQNDENAPMRMLEKMQDELDMDL
jgi:hypothetical protein